MTDEVGLPEPAELERLGLYDPAAPDADDRLELIRHAMERGATIEDVASARNIAALAVDFSLRPRLDTTLREVVDAAGIEWDAAQRLLNVAGLPADPDERPTADEADAVRLFAATTSLLGEDVAIQIARVAGNAMARVAETAVHAFRLHLELKTDAYNAAAFKDFDNLVPALLPAFVRSLDAALRRQIVVAAHRIWSTDPERSAVTLPRTVGFADLVGYTQAAASMSVRELTRVLVEFEDRAADVVAREDGQLVKTIGDSAMFTTEDAAAACRIALALVDEFGEGSLPPVRVGLAAGEVVSVFGDVYGPDVNLAARLMGAADPSTVVVSEPVQAACGDAFRFTALGPLTLKGIPGEVSAYVLDGHADTAR